MKERLNLLQILFWNKWNNTNCLVIVRTEKPKKCTFEFYVGSSQTVGLLDFVFTITCDCAFEKILSGSSSDDVFVVWETWKKILITT